MVRSKQSLSLYCAYCALYVLHTARVLWLCLTAGVIVADDTDARTDRTASTRSWSCRAGHWTPLLPTHTTIRRNTLSDHAGTIPSDSNRQRSRGLTTMWAYRDIGAVPCMANPGFHFMAGLHSEGCGGGVFDPLEYFKNCLCIWKHFNHPRVYKSDFTYS